MNSIDLAYIINQLLNFKLEENENELEKKELLYNNVYEKLKVIKEISNCNDSKIKLLNTIKEIFTNYEIHQNNLGKKFNNYIIGINHNLSKKTLLKNPHNFLRLNCDDFEICKYEVNPNNDIITLSHNLFLPVQNLNWNDIQYLQLTEINQSAKVIKKSDSKISIEYTMTNKTYINSILHNITKKTYVINDFYIDNFNEIGFNQILEIIYYNIEQKDLEPIYNISITRSSHYPNYVEVIQKEKNKEIKFLTKFNTKKGLNSIDDFESPKENTICGRDANIYTTYMQSGNKINTTLYDFLKEINDEQEKDNLKRYYKKINEKIR